MIARSPWFDGASIAGRRLARGQKIRSNFIDRGRRRDAKFLNLDKAFASFSLYRLPLRNVYRSGSLERCGRQAFVLRNGYRLDARGDEARESGMAGDGGGDKSSIGRTALAGVAALGVVFGDIGTSPLYTLKTCSIRPGRIRTRWRRSARCR